MKIKNVISSVGLAMILGASMVQAASWEDLLQGVDGQTFQDDGHSHTGTLYNATIEYISVNGNGDGIFSDDEVVYIKITGPNGEVLETTENGHPGNLHPYELEAWAKANADALIKYIFGSDPMATATGTQNSVVEAATVIANSIIKNTKRSKEARAQLSGGTGYNSKVLLDAESASITNDGVKSKATSFTFDMNFDSETLNGEIGSVFIYKHVKSDQSNTKSHSLNLSPYYRFYQDISDDLYIAYVANVTANIHYLKSDVFTDGAGYLEYGAGLTIVPDYAINDQLSINGIIGVQIIEKYVPVSKLDGDLQFIAEAINNLPWQKSTNFGIGAQYEPIPNMLVNVNMLRVSQLGSEVESDKKNSMYYTASVNYYDNSWSYSLGYKTVRGVADYDEDAYMLGVQYNW
jgi:hypothetical protein